MWNALARFCYRTFGLRNTWWHLLRNLRPISKKSSTTVFEQKIGGTLIGLRVLVNIGLLRFWLLNGSSFNVHSWVLNSVEWDRNTLSALAGGHATAFIKFCQKRGNLMRLCATVIKNRHLIVAPQKLPNPCEYLWRLRVWVD